MHICTEKNDTYTELIITGRVDASTAEELDEAAAAALQKAGGAVVVNFAGVEYISSAGLRSVLKIAKTCQSKQMQLRCFALQPAVFDVFRLAGFSTIIKINATKEEALDSLK